MSTRLNTLLHGSTEDVLKILDAEEPLTEEEMQAALTNVFRHIESLKTRIDRVCERLTGLDQRTKSMVMY